MALGFPCLVVQLTALLGSSQQLSHGISVLAVPKVTVAVFKSPVGWWLLGIILPSCLVYWGLYNHPTGNPYKPTRIQWNDRRILNTAQLQILADGFPLQSLLPHMMFDVKPTNHGSELVASYRCYPSSGNIFKCYCPSSSMFLALYVPIFTRSSNGDQPPVRNHPSPGPNSADSPSRSTKANQNFSISGNVKKKTHQKICSPKKDTKKRHMSMSTSNNRSQTHSAATATEHKPSPRRCLARVARRAASSSSSGSIKRFWSSWWGGTNPFTRNRDMMGPLVGYFFGRFCGTELMN